MSSNLELLYQQVFNLLEISKQTKELKNYSQTIQLYLNSCQLFQQIISLESNNNKKQLIKEQINYYTEEINKLRILNQINEADKVFSNAISLDEQKKDQQEIERQYLLAAEMYMNILKLNEDSKIKSRVALIINRVEEIKGLKQEHETLLEDLDLPTIDPNQPLKQTTNKMKSSSSSSSSSSSISSPTSASSPSSPPILSPSSSLTSSTLSSSSLTQEEILVLRQSSIINGKCFQPWLDGEETREKFNYGNNIQFNDPDGILPLSESQKRSNGIYRRPIEFLPPSQPPVVIRMITPLAITQDLVADCSFVCSLCIAAAFEARHNKRLITSIIYPQNNKGIPVYNPSGKYLVKFYVNGVYRKVIVDDKLPISETSGRLLCSASKDPTELWVSLIEKAYMKLNGGYDFPGSNSGIDLHALTGWIPEQVFFVEDSAAALAAVSNPSSNSSRPADFRQSEDRAWERISSAHRFGDCLITISTGTLTTEEEESTGLVSGHAYAVLNVQSAGILRMLQVRNPWARKSWKGRFSSRDRNRWTFGLKNALNVKDEDFDKMDEEGIFWIEFSDCRTYFRSFFLNWNPSLFSFRWSTHASWPVTQGPKFDTYYIGANPQYSLKIEGRSQNKDSVVSSSVWVLLTRHITSTAEEIASNTAKDDVFLTIHVHRNGKRIYAPVQPFIKGIYSSDPHILTRIDVSSDDTREANEISLEHPQGKPIEYTLVLSQSEKKKDINYTLSIYSTTLPFICQLCPSLPLNQLTVTGAWTVETAGGNVNSPNFYRNPQYRLTIHGDKGWDMHIQAMFSKEINASISIIDPKKNFNSKTTKLTTEELSRVGRIDTIANDAAEVLTSGNYRPGFCYCATERLKPGDYIVVISTYEPGAIGSFILTFATNCGSASLTSPSHNKKYFTVKEIPSEGYGMNKIGFNGEWKTSDGTAAGCSNYSNYHLNPLYLLTLDAPATIICRLNIENWTASSHIGLNISIFDANTSLEQKSSSTSSSDQVTLNTDGELAIDNSTTTTQPSSSSSSSSSTTTTRFSFSGKMLSSCSPSNAMISSNNGIYVIRPCGASIQATELQTGRYLIVPSTFEPQEKRYNLDIYILSSLGQSSSGYNIIKLR